MAVVYWRIAILLLAGILSGCEAVVTGISNLLSPPQQLYLVRSLTARSVDDHRPPGAQYSFRVGDTVYFCTVATWERVDRSAGLHHIDWKWYSGGRLVVDHSRQMMFPHAPYRVFGAMPALDLGGGHHRVEVYVDDKLFDTAEFDVVPKTASS